MDTNRIRHLVSSLAVAACTAALAPAQQFTNGSFENWGPSNVCMVNTPPDDWQNFSTVGIGVDEGDFSVCPHSVPIGAADGDAYCRAYAPNGGGEGIVQTVDGFLVGSVYRITYRYSGSNLYGGIANGKWGIYFDGTLVHESPTIASSQTSWGTHSYTFTATATSHAIGFRGIYAGPSSSASLGLDDVRIEIGASNFGVGTGCPASSPLALGTGGAPQLGGSWPLFGSNIENVMSIALFWFGDQKLDPGFDLTAFGASGCFAFTNGNLGVFTEPVSAGTASYVLNVPNVSALMGTQLTVQMSAASTATPSGYTTSNGVFGTVGF